MSRKRPTWSISDHVDSQSKYMKRSVSAKQARAIAAKMNKRFPYKDYGRMYVKRNQLGSQSMLAFGPSYRTADAQQRANRKQYGYYGNGLYTGRGRFNLFKSIGRGFKKIGRALKPVAKEALHAGIHAGVGALMGGGLYTGRGSYTDTNLNTLISGSEDPAMQVSGVGDETESVIITHKEFIGDVYGPPSQAFNNQAYETNPGLADVFPWLSQIAVNYDEYEWIQLVFEYRSTVDATSVTNGQTGTLIMATNYNLDSPVFQSKEDMMQYHGAMSGRLTEHMAHGVECDPSKNAGHPVRQVRNKPLDKLTQNVEDYDMARFEFGINNSPTVFANQAIGELWVYYRVRLLKPRLGANKGLATQYAYFGATTNCTNADPLAIATSNTLTAQNSLNIGLEYAASKTVGGTAYSNATILKIPANFSGILRIVASVESTSGTAITGFWDNNLVTQGNVSFLADQYCSLSASGDNPANRRRLTQSEVFSTTFNVRCRSATGGVDNLIVLSSTLGGSPITATLEIYEMPDIGRSPSDPRPKFFDVNGNRAELN